MCHCTITYMSVKNSCRGLLMQQVELPRTTPASHSRVSPPSPTAVRLTQLPTKWPGRQRTVIHLPGPAPPTGETQRELSVPGVWGSEQ